MYFARLITAIGLSSFLLLFTNCSENPIQTDLIKNASERGLKTSNGLPMLLHQAALSWKIWFDILPEINSELLEIVENKLKI